MTTTVTTTLRPTTAADYPALVAVANAANPTYQETEEDFRHWDATRPAHCAMERIAAEREGQIVGFGSYFHAPWMYHPRQLLVYVNVAPAHQGQGIGARLYDELIARMAAHQPERVRTDAREDWGHSMRFIAARGFREEMRSWESRLDLAAFDPAPFGDQTARIAGQGYVIRSLAEFLAAPDARRRLYEAMRELRADVPQPEPFTMIAFPEWEQSLFSDQNLYPEGYFLALRGDEIAAVSQLWRYSEPGVLLTGLTATGRAHRRQGLALALKLHAIAFARGQGFREVRTGNASTNRPMLAINEALGFVKEPAWVSFVKDLAA